MTQLICLNKPFQVPSQFTDTEGRSCLADFIHYKGYYPAGRLDYDSEGLILLTDNGQLQKHISHPDKKMPKTYWVQVEGEISFRGDIIDIYVKWNNYNIIGRLRVKRRYL